MSQALGFFVVGSVVRKLFNTVSQLNVPITLVSGIVRVYKDGDTAESAAGITLTTDFDGVTGQHLVTIVTSADTTFYAAGSTYTIVLVSGTVDTLAVSVALASFSLYSQAQAAAIAAIPVTVTPAAGAVTFEAIWRVVLGHCPIAGAALAREWTQWAYSELIRARRSWSHLRVQSALSVAVSRTGTVTLTTASTAVVAGTLTFTNADIGRQLRVSGNAIYTIVAVAGGNATLDRVYAEAGGTLTATVADIYLTMPADFARFDAVIDPSNRWRLHYNVPADVLNRIDPVRTSSSTPRLLANATFSPVPSTLGRARYELYPYSSEARVFPCWYYRSGEILSDDTVLTGSLINQKDVLVEGALSRCALWPGLENRKNPYFSLPLAQAHEAKFREKISQLYVMDEELMWEGMPVAEMTYAAWPFDGAYLQQTDIPAFT